MSDMNCPYCGSEQEVCHDDNFGYSEDVPHEYECGSCEKHFVFYTTISISYEAQKADCLNDGNHQWKPSVTYPKWYTKMCCHTCGSTRTPTEAEKITHNIPQIGEHDEKNQQIWPQKSAAVLYKVPLP